MNYGKEILKRLSNHFRRQSNNNNKKEEIHFLIKLPFSYIHILKPSFVVHQYSTKAIE